MGISVTRDVKFSEEFELKAYVSQDSYSNTGNDGIFTSIFITLWVLKASAIKIMSTQKQAYCESLLERLSLPKCQHFDKRVPCTIGVAA